ncbi:MAG: thiamine/thiamine pyrophosphate ABC transporter permease ThiP [Aestuariivita sp.]|nr:thiamine/thiamine pyrophosphate ABC transporter permease ThiP [Aestuariivita sp.]MCY4346135.1 thiamine/thiamine pyrophosphate ABC transporter permease ThiP [Aestuariivita sp.]
MASGPQSLGWIGRTGIAFAVSVPTIILLSVAAIISVAEAGSGLTSGDWAALRFTIWQATLSAVISVLLAVPLARALARRNFVGRGVVITLLGAPFLLPVIVAVFGLLAVFGRNGVLNAVLETFAFEPISIFGLHGVVLAHVFFNLPLATRFILQGWQEIPAERFRLAASLGMDTQAINRHLEWPMLKKVLPCAFVVIFAVCTTTFAVALILGGGPRATTVELAIYQSLRFEFDLRRAAFLALMQIGIMVLLAFIAHRILAPALLSHRMDRPVIRWDGRGFAIRMIDYGVIVGAIGFLLMPITMVMIQGLPKILSLPAVVWESLFRSLIVAVSSTIIVLGILIPMSYAAARRPRQSVWIESAGLMSFAVSSLVLGTGLFVVINPIMRPDMLALPITALVNALATLPFALRSVLPAFCQAEADYGRLADSIGLTPWARLKFIFLQRSKREIGFIAGLAAALSMGDLGVITLFALPDTPTLPLQIYRLMGAYRMQEAAGASVLLLLCSFGLFWLLDQGARRVEI